MTAVKRPELNTAFLETLFNLCDVTMGKDTFLYDNTLFGFLPLLRFITIYFYFWKDYLQGNLVSYLLCFACVYL